MKTRRSYGWLMPVMMSLVVMWGCARERSRTDIALELTDEDSVEAIIDQDLLTAGGTVINVEQEGGTSALPTGVAYVDEVEMQKPVLVETDERLKPPTAETGSVGGLEEPVVATSDLVQDTESLLAELNVPLLDTQKVGSAMPGASGAATGTGVAGGPPTTAGVTLPSTGGAGLTGADMAALAREAAAPALPAAETGPVVIGTPAGYYPDAYRTPVLPDRYPRHTVVRGDSLWSIARKYGCTVSELAAANGMTRSSVLQIGQVLVVPVAVKTTSPSAALTPAAPSPTTPPTEAPDVSKLPVAEGTSAPADAAIRGMATETYTVQAGDSYWKIARRYGITAQELMALNDTSDSRLQVGQKILVPKK